MPLGFSDVNVQQGLVCYYPEPVPLRDPGADWGAGMALNSATAGVVYQFRVYRSCRLDALRIFLHTVSGSPSASDIVFALRNTLSSGAPDESGDPIATATLPDLTTGIKTISFPTHSLDANKTYSVVVRNTNSDPTTNYVTIQHRRGSFIVFPFGTGCRSGFWGGTSWTWSSFNSSSGSPNFEYALTDGNTTEYYGVVNSNSQSDYDLNAAGRILAIQTTVPFRSEMLGLVFYVKSMAGQLNGTIRLRVWRVLSGNLQEVHTGNALTYWTQTMIVQPDSEVVLEQGETYRVGIEKVSGTNTFTFRTLLQEGWRQYPTVHYYNGSSWQDLTTRMVAMALVLRPLGSAGGGSGQPVIIPTHKIIT